jgi:hypothetical protein
VLVDGVKPCSSVATLTAPLAGWPKMASGVASGAVGVALANALSIVRSPVARPRLVAVESELQAPETRHEPSADEMFRIGLDELRKVARLKLVPQVPQATVKDFPLGAWWEEAKLRRAAGTLDIDTKRTIADSVSWLAPDLVGTPHSVEMMGITEFTGAGAARGAARSWRCPRDG